jgi:hypothetical protein
MSEERLESRRGVLKYGLAGVAGIFAGHSILQRNALADAGANMTVSIPKLAVANGALTAAGRNQALDSIAPVMTGILQSAGLSLTAAQATAVRNNLLSSGQILLPTAAMAGAISVSTVNWRSVGAIRETR